MKFEKHDLIIWIGYPIGGALLMGIRVGLLGGVVAGFIGLFLAYLFLKVNGR